MFRFRPALPLAFVLCAALPAAAGADSAREAKVRAAVERTYVHGMTDAIAREEVGAEAIPLLLQLLFEPDLPRRDNVVAFLAHLDGEGMTPGLLAFLDGSPGRLDDPDEERAILLVPLALARRAARGDAQARAALGRMVEPGLAPAERPGPSSLAPLLRSQSQVALGRIDDRAALEGTEAPAEPSVAAALLDTNARQHRTALSVANHVSVPSKVSASDVDQILARASDVAQTADFAEDVACCVGFVRNGSVATFGTAGDGRDSIDTQTELETVLNLRVARVKVVRVINFCGKAGTNIIGCSYTPGFGMAVVRTASEGILWLHEYGHNAGLGHVSDSRNVMNPFLVSTALGLNQSECNSYHAPPALAQANPQDVGACASQTGCTDADQDGYGSPGSEFCASGSATDCNDANVNVYPGRRDLCNGVDNDCDGRVDDDAVCATFDVNGDGRVAGLELAWIGRAFGLCSANPAGQWWFEADYDADGCVDGVDLSVLSVAWNCTGARSICP